jgi:hypothetical protein
MSLTCSLGEIDLRRYQAIDQIIGEIHKLLDKYRNSAYTYLQDSTLSDFCDSLMLGALTRHLDGWSLLSPRPEVPFDGMSFYELCTKARNKKFRKWQADPNSSYSPGRSGGALQNCSSDIDVAKIVSQATAKVAGLSLRHMQEPKKSTTEVS